MSNSGQPRNNIYPNNNQRIILFWRSECWLNRTYLQKPRSQIRERGFCQYISRIQLAIVPTIIIHKLWNNVWMNCYLRTFYGVLKIADYFYFISWLRSGLIKSSLLCFWFRLTESTQIDDDTTDLLPAKIWFHRSDMSYRQTISRFALAPKPNRNKQTI